MNGDALGRLLQEATVEEGAAPGRGIIYQRGDTVPTDADTGYAIGCLFVQTDGSAGTVLYINEGDIDSCDFNPANDAAALSAAVALLLPLAGGTLTGDLTMTDGEHIILGTTSGSKIGTAVTQKLGFWNATPVVQASGATQAAPAAYGTGAFGLDSDANMQALYDLVVAMRTALVNAGIMKGAA